MNLIITNNKCLQYLDLRKAVVLNFSSYTEGVERIEIIPSVYGYDRTSVEFDRYLFSYIYDNDNIFMEFSKIFMSLYYDKDVVLLATRDEGIFDDILESLLKLVQQRFGVTASFVEDINDVDCIEESEFSIQGLYNLDMDKERFMLLYISMYGMETNGGE